ncbi:probable pectinesterase/pectinesterase inhibitor 20 isoform X2 [Vicia villosa]|uniref:probable pectinesterase/pectinesterase inhibitor 20 isoform X2 n=1 Tax=Vicia villosa TaxID=3911 RepID=UPI00273C7AB0|nr:probable pectinesterase/pectinesterase inhibitor 20 [Vicia villosa]XP_058767655.1 probable pectinesterase/pectinesterase inhibitor 20 isoform X2 [Vicia villosa]
MAFKNFSYLLSMFLIFVSLCIANAVPPETICNSIVNPTYCKTVIGNQNGNIYDYGRISIQKSLSQSHKFINLLDSYLQGSSSLTQSTIHALEDCRFLASLSFEYLSNTYATTNTYSNVLPTSQAEDFETFLSAVLTNQQTCLDGLDTIVSSDHRVKNDLSLSLSNEKKLNSVTLALFLKGWMPEKKIRTSWPQSGKHLNFKNGRLPLKMSNKAHAIYDSARRHGRKLVQTQTDENSVVVSDIVVVSQDGSGNFSTINEAIAAAPNNTVASDGYFLIFITEGVYQEYVSIDKKKKYLMLVGEGINKTVITGNHNVVDGFTTFNSATFAVVGQGFVGVNITFRNTAGPGKHQAVAMRSGADMSTFYRCSFEGYQDTLYTHSLRQFYRECDIYGTVDFIFGNAAVVLQNCNIYPRLPLNGQFNTITAQGRTDPNQNTGTSIQNATIKAADDLAPNVGTVETYLGRPWKNYSRTVVMQSSMDSFINPSGWHIWDGDFALSTLYYAEYDNRGGGSSTANRVTWSGYHVIDASDAANFTVSNFVSGDDWIPQTGVPYLTGLI